MRIAFALILAAVALDPVSASAEPAAASKRADLADIAQGTYYGNVMSDARGSSQSDVTITVTKTAPRTVTVSSNYARLPTFTVSLTRAMETIQQASGDAVFLLDLSRTPNSLHVTVDDAAWAGERQ